MQTEYEVKILDIDVEKVRKKLHNYGATALGKKNFLRNTYDLDDNNVHKWLRLRTDGEKTTLTVKERQHEGVDGTKELEVDVGDFAITEKILEKLGFRAKNVQENTRESYLLDEMAIDIDQWPGIPAYLEVEGKNEEVVRAMVEKLGFSWSETTTMHAYQVYKKYGKDISKEQHLRF